MQPDQTSPTTEPTTPPVAVPLATPVQTEDEGIFCPICNYNLTGNYLGRCPECGAFFDREALLVAQRTNQLTLIPWDDPRPIPFFTRLFETLGICLFAPKDFAFAFSVQPQRTRAWSLFLGLIVVINSCAIGVVTLASMFNPLLSNDSVGELLLIIFCFMLASTLLIAGSSFCSAIILWITSPHYDGQRHLGPWISICAYAACHYLLVLTLIPLALFAAIFETPLVILAVVAPLFLYGCGGLAGFTLRAVAEHRTAQHRRSMLAPLMLLAIYILLPIAILVLTGVVVSFVERVL